MSSFGAAFLRNRAAVAESGDVGSSNNVGSGAGAATPTAATAPPPAPHPQRQFNFSGGTSASPSGARRGRTSTGRSSVGSPAQRGRGRRRGGGGGARSSFDDDDNGFGDGDGDEEGVGRSSGRSSGGAGAVKEIGAYVLRRISSRVPQDEVYKWRCIQSKGGRGRRGRRGGGAMKRTLLINENGSWNSYTGTKAHNIWKIISGKVSLNSNNNTTASSERKANSTNATTDQRLGRPSSSSRHPTVESILNATSSAADRGTQHHPNIASASSSSVQISAADRIRLMLGGVLSRDSSATSRLQPPPLLSMNPADGGIPTLGGTNRNISTARSSLVNPAASSAWVPASTAQNNKARGGNKEKKTRTPALKMEKVNEKNKKETQKKNKVEKKARGKGNKNENRKHRSGDDDAMRVRRLPFEGFAGDDGLPSSSDEGDYDLPPSSGSSSTAVGTSGDEYEDDGFLVFEEDASIAKKEMRRGGGGGDLMMDTLWSSSSSASHVNDAGGEEEDEWERLSAFSDYDPTTKNEKKDNDGSGFGTSKATKKGGALPQAKKTAEAVVVLDDDSSDDNALGATTSAKPSCLAKPEEVTTVVYTSTCGSTVVKTEIAPQNYPSPQITLVCNSDFERSLAELERERELEEEEMFLQLAAEEEEEAKYGSAMAMSSFSSSFTRGGGGMPAHQKIAKAPPPKRTRLVLPLPSLSSSSTDCGVQHTTFMSVTAPTGDVGSSAVLNKDTSQQQQQRRIMQPVVKSEVPTPRAVNNLPPKGKESASELINVVEILSSSSEDDYDDEEENKRNCEKKNNSNGNATDKGIGVSSKFNSVGVKRERDDAGLVGKKGDDDDEEDAPLSSLWGGRNVFADDKKGPKRDGGRAEVKDMLLASGQRLDHSQGPSHPPLSVRTTAPNVTVESMVKKEPNADRDAAARCVPHPSPSTESSSHAAGLPKLALSATNSCAPPSCLDLPPPPPAPLLERRASFNILGKLGVKNTQTKPFSPPPPQDAEGLDPNILVVAGKDDRIVRRTTEGNRDLGLGFRSLTAATSSSPSCSADSFSEVLGSNGAFTHLAAPSPAPAAILGRDRKAIEPNIHSSGRTPVKVTSTAAQQAKRKPNVVRSVVPPPPHSECGKSTRKNWGPLGTRTYMYTHAGPSSSTHSSEHNHDDDIDDEDTPLTELLHRRQQQQTVSTYAHNPFTAHLKQTGLHSSCGGRKVGGGTELAALGGQHMSPRRLEISGSAAEALLSGVHRYEDNIALDMLGEYEQEDLMLDMDETVGGYAR